MHYYRSPLSGETIIAWMFPKRDHLSIGLGMGPKVDGAVLRAELDWFLPRVQARLFPGIAYTTRAEGNLLYGGKPRPRIGTDPGDGRRGRRQGSSMRPPAREFTRRR